MKNEKGYYEDFIKYLSLYNDEKKKMEKNKNIYHFSARIAEKSTIYLKELVIKKRLNNDDIILNQQLEISENESKNRLTIMSKDCETYIKSLDYVNNMRIKLNNKQANLLKLYEELEKQNKNIYSKIMENFRIYQKK